MTLKNTALFITLLLFSPCLGFEPMIGNGGSSDSDDLESNEKAIQELHAKYKALINNAIAEGKDLNELKTACFNPIIIALAIQGFNDLIEKALNNGVDIETQNCSGKSPLVEATTYGNIQTVKLLLEYNADIENKNGHELPLTQAASCIFKKGENNTSIIELLLNAGANINAQEFSFKTTALHNTLSQFSLPDSPLETRKLIVTTLINHGADLNIKNNVGKTPLSLAQQNFPELVPVMLKALEDREVR
jgi:ankyrin repeat protein